MNYAVILCAGVSQRFGKDKLFATLQGKPLIAKTVGAFLSCFDKVLLVGNDSNISTLKDIFGDSAEYCLGGSTRTASVRNALAHINECDFVAIHDGARPFVSEQLINRLLKEAEKEGNAIPALSPTDAICDSTGKQLDRSKLFSLQTPQVFSFGKIVTAYSQAESDYYDDSTIYYAKYGSINIVEGERTNIKVTYESDLPTQKIGYGYDIHRTCKNRKLYLGGVQIDCGFGLDGHSDADVVLHSVMDALLSSVSLADIGHYFPVNDDKYKDADSKKLLAKVVNVLAEQNAHTLNVSIAIVAEQPKISPYLMQMKQTIASILNVETKDVGISATTAESVGEIGKGEAIASRCVALVSVR